MMYYEIYAVIINIYMTEYYKFKVINHSSYGYGLF